MVPSLETAKALLRPWKETITKTRLRRISKDLCHVGELTMRLGKFYIHYRPHGTLPGGSPTTLRYLYSQKLFSCLFTDNRRNVTPSFRMSYRIGIWLKWLVYGDCERAVSHRPDEPFTRMSRSSISWNRYRGTKAGSLYDLR